MRSVLKTHKKDTSRVSLLRGGAFEYLNCSPGGRRGQQKGSQCLGYNGAIIFVADINTGS
jgi:hypothetical protein